MKDIVAKKWWKNGEPGNGDGLWFIYGQTIGRVLTGCYKLYLLAVILLSNQTSQTWQWKIPAFTDDFPNSTYTSRRFSIAMFVDHKVLLFFCFVFLCVRVCVSYWVLAGKAKVRRTSQKKGIGSHTLAKVCKADSGAIWNWNYRDLKKTVWIWAVAEKIWVYGWTTNFIICFSYILRDFKFEMISWQDCPPSGDQGLCHEKSIQCSNWTRWIWTGTAIRRPPHLLVAIGHQQDVDDLPFQFATVLYYIHQK